MEPFPSFTSSHPYRLFGLWLWAPLRGPSPLHRPATMLRVNTFSFIKIDFVLKILIASDTKAYWTTLV